MVSTISAILTMSRPRKWHLADWQSINERMHCLLSWFISNCSIETELWNVFKDEYHKCLQLIPSKVCVPSSRHPWINKHIKRLSNRKRNLYNKARISQLESDWKALKI